MNQHDMLRVFGEERRPEVKGVHDMPAYRTTILAVILG